MTTELNWPYIEWTIESAAISDAPQVVREAAEMMRALWGRCAAGTPAASAMAEVFRTVNRMADDVEAGKPLS